MTYLSAGVIPEEFLNPFVLIPLVVFFTYVAPVLRVIGVDADAFLANNLDRLPLILGLFMVGAAFFVSLVIGLIVVLVIRRTKRSKETSEWWVYGEPYGTFAREPGNPGNPGSAITTGWKKPGRRNRGPGDES